MKRVILMAIGSALLLPSQAQLQNKKYTNFNDSIFSINEVVVSTNYRRKTDALKLDVPAKFIPISTNSITSGMLEKRNIRDIQEAARFLPGDGIDRFLQNVSEIVVQRQQMVHLLVYVVGETDVNYPVFAVQNLEYA